LVLECCIYCRPGGRKSQRTSIAPLSIPDFDPGGERLLIEEDPDKEDGELDEREPAEEVAFNPRAFPWDLRESDATPDAPAPKTRQYSTRSQRPVTPEKEENPITIANKLRKLRANKWTINEIATAFHKSEPWVHQHLSLLKLIPKVQALMDPARPKSIQLNLTVAAALASLPPHLQEQYAQEVLVRHWTAQQAARHVRMRTQQERVSAKKLSRPVE